MVIMSRRAQVTIQLNWIFVLIAGGVILLFFASLIRSQIKASEDKMTVQTLQDIDKLLTAAFISTESYQLTALPDVAIELACNEYTIRNGQHDLGNRVVFGPKLIQGDDLFSWSKDLEYPFRVTNFLYVTSPEILYLFIYPDNDIGVNNSFQNLQLSLKDKIASNVLSASGEREKQGFNYLFRRESQLNGVVIKNNYHVRAIFLGVEPRMSASMKQMDDSQVSALKVTGALDSGTIEFYEKSNYLFTPKTNASYPYVSFEMLLGAIFSEESETFSCNLGKVMTHYERVNSIYTKRARQLEDTYHARSSFCEPFYLSIIDTMGEVNTRLNGAYNASVANMLKSYKSSLQSKNEELLTGSCETIY